MFPAVLWTLTVLLSRQLEQSISSLTASLRFVAVKRLFSEYWFWTWVSDSGASVRRGRNDRRQGVCAFAMLFHQSLPSSDRLHSFAGVYELRVAKLTFTPMKCPTVWTRLPRHRRLAVWDKTNVRVVPLDSNYTSTLWQVYCENAKLEETLLQGNWDMFALPSIKVKVFLSVHVVDIKNGSFHVGEASKEDKL